MQVKKFIFGFILGVFALWVGQSINKDTPHYTEDYVWSYSEVEEEEHNEGRLVAIEKYLSQHPRDIQAMMCKAAILNKRGESEKAIRVLNEVLQLDEDNDSALNNRGMYYNELSLFTFGLEDIEKAMTISGGTSEEYANKGNALLGLERMEEAIEAYDKGIALDNNSAYCHYGKGVVYQNAGLNEKAFEAFKKAFNINPKDDDYYYGVIQTGYSLEKYKELLPVVEKKAKSCSDPETIDYYRIDIRLELGEYAEALEAIAAYQQETEYLADSYYLECRAYIGLGDLESAYTSLKKCVELDSEYFYYIDPEEVKALVGYSDFDKVFEKMYIYNEWE